MVPSDVLRIAVLELRKRRDFPLDIRDIFFLRVEVQHLDSDHLSRRILDTIYSFVVRCGLYEEKGKESAIAA